MATINEYFENAQLSQAAYANLYQGISDLDYKLALNNAGMAQDQFEQFAARYTIINQQPNTSTGFSATLFWDWEQAQYTLAMRGTEILIVA